jgi:hypothetical protein
MKLKMFLVAGALAALPIAALAQQPAQQQTTTTTSTTSDASGESTKVVTVTGAVQSYEVGHSITIAGPDGELTTYVIDESSQIPKIVEVGKTVTIETTTVSGTPMVKTLTVKRTTKTTTTKKKSS